MPAQPAKRRFALLVAYDGAAFHGWQMLADRSSVQESIGQALLDAGLAPTVNGASRTDRGVHARAMVASTTTRTPLAGRDLAERLRASLPAALRLRAAAEVGPDFHAQFSSLGKTYRYRLFLARKATPGAGEGRAPRFAWALNPAEIPGGRPELSLQRLRLALQAMVGERSYSGVMAPNARQGLCRIAEARLKRQVERPEGTWLTLSFRADRFGRYMVRTLVGVAVRCAVGELDPALLPKQLDSGLYLSHLVAPPEGLILWKVHYPEAAKGITGDPFPWLGS